MKPGIDMEIAFEPGNMMVYHHHTFRKVLESRTEVTKHGRDPGREGRRADMIQNSEPEPVPPSEQCRTQDGPGSNPVRVIVCIDLDKILPLVLLCNPAYGFVEG